MTKFHQALVAAAALSLILALVARYAEHQYDNQERPVLSPIYSNAVATFVPNSELADVAPSFRPARYYDFTERSAVLFTFILGLVISGITAIYSFMLLRNGYDLPSMVALGFSWAGCMIWDVAIWITVALGFLVVAIFIKQQPGRD